MDEVFEELERLLMTGDWVATLEAYPKSKIYSVWLDQVDGMYGATGVKFRSDGECLRDAVEDAIKQLHDFEAQMQEEE